MVGSLRRCSLVRTGALQPSMDDRQGRLLSSPETLTSSWLLLGNLDLLPPSGKSTKPGVAPMEHKGLVAHNGSLIHVGNLLQRAEQQDSGRLYLENKIHTLELKLGEWPEAAGTCHRWDVQTCIHGD